MDNNNTIGLVIGLAIIIAVLAVGLASLSSRVNENYRDLVKLAESVNRLTEFLIEERK